MNMVRVIVCSPGETAAIEEIDDSLESMQQLVKRQLIPTLMERALAVTATTRRIIRIPGENL